MKKSWEEFRKKISEGSMSEEVLLNILQEALKESRSESWKKSWEEHPEWLVFFLIFTMCILTQSRLYTLPEQISNGIFQGIPKGVYEKSKRNLQRNPGKNSWIDPWNEVNLGRNTWKIAEGFSEGIPEKKISKGNPGWILGINLGRNLQKNHGRNRKKKF